jgi:hypothetical protein
MKTTLILFLFCIFQTDQPIRERWNIKTLTDGYVPVIKIIKPVTVASSQVQPLSKVDDLTGRSRFEKNIISITGVIKSIEHKRDGDLYFEIHDGTLADSTLICEAVNPLDDIAAYSPSANYFKNTWAVAKNLKVGDKIKFTGIAYQGIYYKSPPANTKNRIQNFLEMCPILIASKFAEKPVEKAADKPVAKATTKKPAKKTAKKTGKKTTAKK